MKLDAVAAQDKLSALRREAQALADQAIRRRAAAGYQGVTNLKVQKKTIFGWKKVDQGAYFVTSFRAPFKDTTIEYQVYLLSDGKISLKGGYSFGGRRDIMNDSFVDRYLVQITEGLRSMAWTLPSASPSARENRRAAAGQALGATPVDRL